MPQPVLALSDPVLGSSLSPNSSASSNHDVGVAIAGLLMQQPQETATAQTWTKPTPLWRVDTETIS